MNVQHCSTKSEHVSHYWTPPAAEHEEYFTAYYCNGRAVS